MVRASFYTGEISMSMSATSQFAYVCYLGFLWLHLSADVLAVGYCSDNTLYGQLPFG